MTALTVCSSCSSDVSVKIAIWAIRFANYICKDSDIHRIPDKSSFIFIIVYDIEPQIIVFATKLHKMCRIFAKNLRRQAAPSCIKCAVSLQREIKETAKIWHILIPTNIVKVARTSIITNMTTTSMKSIL